MKRFKVLTIAVFSLVMLSVTGCSAVFRTIETGKTVEKTYDFKDFTQVELSSAFDYEVKKADSYSVLVSTHENVVDRLDIHQSGNTLYVGLKFGLFFNNANRVSITLPQLNKLVVSGACKGTVSGFNSTDDLEISLSGASQADLNAKAGKTRVDLSGSSGLTGDLQALDCQFGLSGASHCELSGSAGNTSIEASGASRMDSPDLVLNNADVTLTGASNANIRTDGRLNINLSGASTLDYSGDPSIGEVEISGASRMNHR